jgi:hypothetical protein
VWCVVFMENIFVLYTRIVVVRQPAFLMDSAVILVPSKYLLTDRDGRLCFPFIASRPTADPHCPLIASWSADHSLSANYLLRDGSNPVYALPEGLYA